MFGRIYLDPYRDPNEKGYLDVSPDGNTWTNVIAGEPGRYNPIDVSDILIGSNTAYVRARLYQEYTTSVNYRVAQFMRTDINDQWFLAPNVYEFRAVPEPATILTLMIGMLGIFRRQ